jgi:hypothetical protein
MDEIKINDSAMLAIYKVLTVIEDNETLDEHPELAEEEVQAVRKLLPILEEYFKCLP